MVPAEGGRDGTNMDHAEARELLELAAVEPRGFERLMAGDTREAAALAGHLAGCPNCADEMARLRRVTALIADTVRWTPPPDLRARTLASVAAVGRARPAPGLDPAPAALASVPAAERRDDPSTGDLDRPRAVGATATTPDRRRRRLDARTAGWIAAAAAALVIAVAGTAAWVGAQGDARLAGETRAVQSLERVAAWTMRISSETDAARIELASTEGVEASGTLLFSPRTRELVVVTSGLPEPPEDREFRCWVEVDGERRPVGRMFFADRLAYWVGEVEHVGDLPDDATFGITLVEAGGTSLDGPATVTGEL